LPWRLATTKASAEADAAPPSAPTPSFRAIIGQREAWGAGLGHFAVNYTFFFVITWLPLYLVKARGFSLVQMAELAGLIYVIYAVSAQVTGWASDRWMAAGASDTLVRKTFCIASHLGCAACMAACAFGGPAVSIASLLLAPIFFGFTTTSIFAIGQTLAGPNAGGKWMGVQNCVGNVAGIVAPLLTGYIVDRTGQFSSAFAIAAVVSLTGVVSWGLVIRRVAPVAWPKAA
jgi:nitrate/nitrite transporter NarK